MSYTDEEMRIFSYHDGYEEKFADPLELLGKLEQVLAEMGPEAIKVFQQDIERIPADPPELREQARREMNQAGLVFVGKMRAMLGLAPVGKGPDGKPTGTPAARVMAIFNQLMIEAEALKNEQGPSVISPSNTVQPSLGQSITEPSSDCT